MIFNLLTGAEGGAGTGSEQANGGGWLTWVILGVFAVLMVAFFIWSSRSNKKKQKEAKDMLAAMKIGDKVKTIGGVCGYLYEINDEENTIVLETGTAEKKSYVKFDRAAIYQTAPVKGIQSAETVKAEEEKTETAENK